ncbi:hypothetical protein M9Y10_016566 [Tritrichomonas musculus]|uniref:Myb-like domain-containing protein n=1 Tax=Tritrichomonas musculus TaxID=1915356 RepID=A0ABR2HWJ4_9EUKA
MKPQYWFPYQSQFANIQNIFQPTYFQQQLVSQQQPQENYIQHDPTNFKKQSQEWKVSAAPFPVLPTKREVYDQIQILNMKIKEQKMNLSSLNKEKQRSSTEGGLQQIRARPFNVDTYRGFQINKNLIDSFLIDNKKRVDKSHTISQVQTDTKYRRIFDLPHYKSMLDVQDENLSVFFSMVYGYHYLNREKKQALLKKYLKYQECQSLVDPATDSINLIQHKDVYYWGPEQTPESTVPFEGPLATDGCSPDVEQHYVDDLYTVNELYNDKNSFVKDPVKEHEEFKKRIYWSEKDKEMFYDLFMSMPHQFRKISTYFPNRTTKDMIEFYYRTKSTFDFESAKAARRNKKQQAGKKKVVTEGTVKRK